MAEQWLAFGKFLLEQLGLFIQFVAGWSLLLFWVAWWLWGVNWPRAWAYLREGAWVPFVLAGVVGALVWSQLAPENVVVLGVIEVSNFWWQLCAVGLLLCSALFCGWLQGYFNWTPEDLALEPPAHGHDDHGHGDHGHGDHHGGEHAHAGNGHDHGHH